MTEDRPIHVRVAEVLGWTDISIFGYGYPLSGPIGPNPRLPAHEAPRLGTTKVPHYDTDWAALGPEIEKRKIQLLWCADRWEADTADEPEILCVASDVRLAVCALLIKLGEKGKL